MVFSYLCGHDYIAMKNVSVNMFLMFLSTYKMGSSVAFRFKAALGSRHHLVTLAYQVLLVCFRVPHDTRVAT